MGQAARGIAIGHDGLFYAVCDSEVQVRDLDGSLLRAWRPFSVSEAIAADEAGRVYLGTSLYSPEGELLGSFGYVDGVPVFPSALALSKDGQLAIADEWWSRIHVFQVASSRFPDVLSHFWALDAIESAADAGIIQGYPDGWYRPEDSVTRDQMAVYVARALVGGEENVPPGPEEGSFGDVPASHWAYDHVEYAIATGVAIGYSDGYYRPENVVTRGEMAVFVARALAGGGPLLPNDPLREPTFPDVTRTGRYEWCYDHVEYLASQKVVEGYPDGLYHPGESCARDQMAVYIQRAFGAPE